MSGCVDAAIARRLQEAAAQGRFAVPQDRNERRAFDRRVASGALISPRPGMYASSAELSLNPRQRAQRTIRTLASAHPHWAMCWYSAALMYGLQVSWDLLDKVHVARRHGENRHTSQAYLVFHTIEHDRFCKEGGVRVTSPKRTLYDCLRIASFPDALAIADSALRARLVSADELAAYVRERAGSGKRRRALERALRYADGRSENGGESIARAVMIELGFAAPMLQMDVADPLERGRCYRVDYLWLRPDGTSVYGELDGVEKTARAAGAGFSGGDARDMAAAARMLRKERERESRLGLLGTVIRFTFREACDRAFMNGLLTKAGVPRAT